MAKYVDLKKMAMIGVGYFFIACVLVLALFGGF